MKVFSYSRSMMLFLLLSCFACKEENAPLPAIESQAEAVMVKNGRLYFASDSVYLEQTNDILYKNDEELNAWENKFGHISLRRKGAQARNELPNYISTILNSKGEY